MWIVMENQNPDVLDNAQDAPYLSGTLRAMGGSATNMYSESRPSLPNYLAMTTGATQGALDNYFPEAYPVSGQSIFSQVDPSWKVYAQDMPSSCAQTNGDFGYGMKYVVRHNPAAYLVSSPVNAPNSDCSVNDVPSGDTESGQLLDDLANGNLPRFSFVVPALCNDMGAPVDGPSCDPNPVTDGDNWLSEWMPAIFNSPDYTSGRLVVFLTWDRGRGGTMSAGMDCLDPQYVSDSACQIPTLVFSTATPGGLQNDTLFSHYSMLKTTEEILGVSTETLGANVSNANSMTRAFNLGPLTSP
jgi:phosphatidylinositol-3-phosphatase